MFTSQVPTFAIDLDQPESRRWSEVIEQMKEPARHLVQEAEHELRHVPQAVRSMFARLYKRSGGLYQKEMSAWAEALGISVGTVTMLNCAYELSHLHLPKLLGCTAGVRWIEGRGMVHVRTLDWPLPTIGDATCLFRFHKGDRQFYVVGAPGQIGVLSGMVPGGYSVTINWAPPARNPNFDFSPTFLLRQVLETCDTYEQAVAALRDTRLSTSVFFTVCGREPGQGCVIERTQRAKEVRGLTEGVVVQANHHESQRFAKHNAKIVLLEDSQFALESGVRSELMHKELVKRPTGDVTLVLDMPPIMNQETMQKMEFCPRSHQVKVWRRTKEVSGPK